MIENIIYDSVDSIRLDIFLCNRYPDKSRSLIQKYIKDEGVIVNNLKVKTGYLLKKGDSISLVFPDVIDMVDIEAKPLPIDILYEDDDFIFVNKPKNMVVHPAPGHFDDTLVNALLYYRKDSLSGINGVLRPGIVHRIDKDTTGVIVVCKNDESHNYMSSLLENHSIIRSYRAIVYGNIIEEEGKISSPIGRNTNDRKKMAVNVKNSKPAVTNYRVIERLKNYTYIECILETGRTHQIRVHMSSIHHPIVGDSVYGNNPKNKSYEGQTLHAYTLGFKHFRTGEDLLIKAPIPIYFENMLTKFRNMNTR